MNDQPQRAMSPLEAVNAATRAALPHVIVALGGDPKKEADKNDALQYISGVMMEVQRNLGDEKKDLSGCTPDSIVQAMIDAARFKLPIDGRGFAHLVKFGNKASLQIGYKGFLYKLSQTLDAVDFVSEPVFEGDELHITDDSGVMTYTRTVADAFCDDITKLRGIVCALSWRIDGERHRKVVTLSKEMIDKIKGTAKQQFIWNAWYLEKAKVAGLKRLCKVHFTNALALQDLIEYDNNENHEMPAAQPAAPKQISEVQQEMLRLAISEASEEGREYFMEKFGAYNKVTRDDFDSLLALMTRHKQITITNQTEEKTDAAANN